MSMANLFILKLIGQINHINIYKESATQLNNLLSLIFMWEVLLVNF